MFGIYKYLFGDTIFFLENLNSFLTHNMHGFSSTFVWQSFFLLLLNKPTLIVPMSYSSACQPEACVHNSWQMGCGV